MGLDEQDVVAVVRVRRRRVVPRQASLEVLLRVVTEQTGHEQPVEVQRVGVELIERHFPIAVDDAELVEEPQPGGVVDSLVRFRPGLAHRYPVREVRRERAGERGLAERAEQSRVVGLGHVSMIGRGGSAVGVPIVSVKAPVHYVVASIPLLKPGRCWVAEHREHQARLVRLARPSFAGLTFGHGVSFFDSMWAWISVMCRSSKSANFWW